MWAQSSSHSLWKKAVILPVSLAVKKTQWNEGWRKRKAGAVEEKQGIEGEREERRQTKDNGRYYWGAAWTLMGSDNPNPLENQDPCSQIKPVRKKQALLFVQLLSLRQRSRWSQFVSGLAAASTSKSHLHQWPFCYQRRHKCQELQDQSTCLLLQALARPPSL